MLITVLVNLPINVVNYGQKANKNKNRPLYFELNQLIDNWQDICIPKLTGVQKCQH